MRFSLKKIISPFWRLIWFLVLIPMLELFLLISILDIWLTLISMFISGSLGVFIAHREGSHCLVELRQHLDRGETPTLPALHGVLILTAAFFMILPGLLTSLFGLILLFPLTRSFFVSYLILRFQSQRLRPRNNPSPRSPEIIDIT